MRPADDIRRFIDKAAVSTNPRADKAVLEVVLAAQEEATDRISAAPRPSLRSIVMRSPITKWAAAAVVIIAVVLFIGLWNRSVSSAYAIEQTLEANQSIRFLHLRSFTIGHDEPREGWIEFGADGQARKARASMPEWMSPVDGPRVLVWRDDTVQMWLKRQNRLTITKAPNALEQLSAGLAELDPRLVVARIDELKSQGQVEVTIEESRDKTRPITMTVTYLPGSGKPGRRQVLSIDPETKLVGTVELYQLQDGQYRREGRIELQEYNQPIDPRVFDLTNEVPVSAERLDHSTTELGLVQGQLSDEEVAVQVVRKFYESIQTGDYEAAARLFPVGAAAALKEISGAVKILRIVSVGPATRIPGPGNKEMAVPCTIEFEAEGQKNSITLKGITVQQLPMQPDHWLIQNLNN